MTVERVSTEIFNFVDDDIVDVLRALDSWHMGAQSTSSSPSSPWAWILASQGSDTTLGMAREGAESSQARAQLPRSPVWGSLAPEDQIDTITYSGYLVSLSSFSARMMELASAWRDLAQGSPEGNSMVYQPAQQLEPGLTQEELEQRVERLFEAAEDCFFEDGMESAFSRELILLVENHCEVMKELLTYWIVLAKASAEVIGEALRWLGQMDHAPSHVFRRWLLKRCLQSPSLMVRDSAGLGLAAMDDPTTAPALRKAIEHEDCEQLRLNLQQVLDQLGG